MGKVKMKQIYEKDFFQTITSILDIEQKLTGIEYLKELIKNIAINLDVKYAFIGHSINEEFSQIQTEVAWANNNFIENFIYQLKDTPCELVLSGKRVCIHAMNVAKDFPEDKLLKEMGIESYVGAPVVSKKSLGVSSILVLLDDKPMKDKNFFTTVTDFLALRAGTEITQHYIEETLLNEVRARTLELEKAKQKIELMNKNLEDRVNEEVKENAKKQQIISQQSKMAAMGEMIENIAHQWRQPLSVISTVSSSINFKDEMNVLQEDDIKMGMDTIYNSVQYLSQTIDDFRDFFKSDKIKNEFIINHTFIKTFKLIRTQFKTANIIIEQNIQEISFYGLENELIQVLMNILNNARDELVRKKQKIKLILVEVRLNDNVLEIDIKDNAGGIPSDIIEEIFESHFTTKQDSNGTGIGLHMSKMIVEEHMNGRIEAKNINFMYKNNSYDGAQFIISLPLVNEK